MKKKILAILSAAVFLTACSGTSTATENNASSQDNSSATEAVQSTVTAVESDAIVEEYDENEYTFGQADIVCSLPSGWKASGDYEGEYIPKSKKDLSSINQIIYDSDENLTLMTKEEYKEQIDTEFESAYGENPDIDITQYDKIMVDGRPGLCIVYNYDLKNSHYETLVYILYNGTESNIITFLQAPGADWMEEFVECAKTIHYSDSEEVAQ